ncbi:MAG: hypothetical protein IKE53_06230 [Clostridiales bacterium]|nr:hypothetical protein [Clostridiales bacterium]
MKNDVEAFNSVSIKITVYGDGNAQMTGSTSGFVEPGHASAPTFTISLSAAVTVTDAWGVTVLSGSGTKNVKVQIQDWGGYNHEWGMNVTGSGLDGLTCYNVSASGPTPSPTPKPATSTPTPKPASPTPTKKPTNTPKPATATPTKKPTSTPKPATATPTKRPTATPKPGTATPTPRSATATPTNRPATSTPTPTQSPNSTPTNTPTPKPTSAATSTPTPTEAPIPTNGIVIPGSDETDPSDPSDPTDPTEPSATDAAVTEPSDEGPGLVHTNPTGGPNTDNPDDKGNSLWWLWLIPILLIGAGAFRYRHLRRNKGMSNKEAWVNLIPGTSSVIYAVSNLLPSKKTETVQTATSSSQTGAGLATAMKEINEMKKAEAQTSAPKSSAPSNGLKAPVKRPAQYSVNRAAQNNDVPTSDAAKSVLEKTDTAKSAPVGLKPPVKRPAQFSSNPNVARQAKIENEAPKRPAASVNQAPAKGVPAEPKEKPAFKPAPAAPAATAAATATAVAYPKTRSTSGTTNYAAQMREIAQARKAEQEAKSAETAAKETPAAKEKPALKPPVKRPAQFSSNPNVARQARIENEAPKRPAASAAIPTSAAAKAVLDSTVTEPAHEPTREEIRKSILEKIEAKNRERQVEGKTETPRKISPSPFNKPAPTDDSNGSI